MTGDKGAGDGVGFLGKARENPDLNQYWYSPNTITAIVEALQAAQINACAFLSTPSLFFSLDDARLRERSVLFDYDTATWSGGQFYDYRAPLTINSRYAGAFDCVVIDPPFIGESVWRFYAESASFLLKSGKVVLTTIAENKDLIAELFGARRVCFQPCVPNLVYQYDLFTNFEAPTLDRLNPEISN